MCYHFVTFAIHRLYSPSYFAGSPDKQLQKYLRENPTNTINFHYPTRKELYSLLYHSEESPYKNYKVVDTAVDIGNSYKSHSWVNSDMIQGKVLRLLHHEPPNFVLEVSTILFNCLEVYVYVFENVDLQMFDSSTTIKNIVS